MGFTHYAWYVQFGDGVQGAVADDKRGHPEDRVTFVTCLSQPCVKNRAWYADVIRRGHEGIIRNRSTRNVALVEESRKGYSQG